jgi:ribosomal protein L37AE/L43A
MRKIKKITVKARLDAAIESIPEADRTTRVRAALQGLGGSLHMTTMVPCPVCGQNTLPAEYSHGIRRCRNCCYYNQQTFSPEIIAETIADSLSWMRAHDKAVA